MKQAPQSAPASGIEISETKYTARQPKGEARRKAALDAAWDVRRKNIARRIEHEAVALCLAKGFDAVTIDEIAAAANISKRSFYRFFESPGDIIHAILFRSNDVWAAAFRERPLNEPILESFRAAFAYINQRPQLVPELREVMEVIGRSRETWKRISGPSYAYSTAIFQEILADRMTANGQDPRLAGAIAAALTAMMIHIAERSADEGQPDNGADFENAIEAFQMLLAPGTHRVL